MLNVALSGLKAFQTALDTTSHNISNANTPGYSRQRVDLATQPAQGTAGIFTGSGVKVSSVSRYSDDLLSLQMRSASSDYSRLDTYATKAGDLNNLFADSTTGLSASLQDFANALQGVASAPSSVANRQLLLSQAGNLVTRLQSYQSSLDSIDTSVNQQLSTDAASINSIAQNIAKLNQQIAAVGVDGASQPNDLLDARDKQLADLSALVDTSVVKQDDGTVSVFIGSGQSLVLGGQASEVITKPDAFQPNRVTLAFQSPSGTMDITNTLSGGEVGGLLDFRREMLDPTRNQLGLMAVAISDATNTQHEAGQDLNGDMGGALFAVGSVQAQGAGTNTGSAVLSATRTDTGALTTDNYIVRYDSGTWSVQRASTGQAVAYTVGGGGELQFDGLSVSVSGTAQSGDRFLVQPTATAINGMQVLISDPAKIAAAAPIRTTTGSGNTGAATISDGEVLDATNPALRSTVTIQFTSANAWQAVDSSNNVIASGAYTSGGDIDVNGWRVQVSGAAASGDSFTVGSNVGGVGDNRNALKLADVLSQGVLVNGTQSLNDAADRLVSTIGVATNSANTNRDAQQIIYNNAQSAVDSVSGVNLDEEAANMLQYQQAYQAAAQVISVAQTIFETILASVSK